MAVTHLCESPLVKHHHPCVSLSPLCSSKLSHTLLDLKKSQLGTSSFGGKTFQMPKTSSMASRRRRRTQAVASLGGLLGGIFKGTDTGESTRQQYASTVSVINGLEAQMSALSDSELREKTRLFQERAKQGESLDSLLPVSILKLCCFVYYIFYSHFVVFSSMVIKHGFCVFECVYCSVWGCY